MTLRSLSEQLVQREFGHHPREARLVVVVDYLELVGAVPDNVYFDSAALRVPLWRIRRHRQPARAGAVSMGPGHPGPTRPRTGGLDKRPDLETLAEYPLVTCLFSDRPESSLMSSFTARNLTPRIAFTARDADIIKTYVLMGLGVGVLASIAVESGADDDLVAIDASGLFPRLTTWIGFDGDLPLKPSHRAFIQLLAPHLSDRQIEGRSGSLEVAPDGTDLPLRSGPVAPLEMRRCQMNSEVSGAVLPYPGAGTERTSS